MYIESIVTPHPVYGDSGVAAHNPGHIKTEPFAEAAGIQEARQYLAATDDYDTAAWEVTDHVESVVRESLRIADNKVLPKGGGGLFETMCREQITNCIGYTSLGSEALSEAGVSHYVTYINGHWLLSRLSDDNNRLWFTDMQLPKFSREVTSLVSRGGPDSIASQVDKYSHGVAKLDTLGLMALVGQTAEKLEYDHPWLTAKKNTLVPNHNVADRNGRHDAHLNSLVMSLYAPEVGRSIMQDYVQFHGAVDDNNLAMATEHLANMRGLYPEVDARADHAEIKSLVKKLCALGEFKQAKGSVDDYTASFNLTHDSRLKELEGDLLRIISKHSQDPGIAVLSHTAYREAVSRSRRNSTRILGKVAASADLVERLS